ncbi:MAG: hypothetical protein QXW47_06875 [Candidatus Jordarchaeales archaeon]
MSGRLSETNAGSHTVQGKDVLIYGSCISTEHPEVFREISRGRTSLSACLEAEHMNMIVYKLVYMFKLKNPPASLTILTIDGSPHCVQLHYAVQEALRISGAEIPTTHLVIANGKVVEVSSEAVKRSRWLSKIKT